MRRVVNILCIYNDRVKYYQLVHDYVLNFNLHFSDNRYLIRFFVFLFGTHKKIFSWNFCTFSTKHTNNI